MRPLQYPMTRTGDTYTYRYTLPYILNFFLFTFILFYSLLHSFSFVFLFFCHSFFFTILSVKYFFFSPSSSSSAHYVTCNKLSVSLSSFLLILEIIKPTSLPGPTLSVLYKHSVTHRQALCCIYSYLIITG